MLIVIPKVKYALSLFKSTVSIVRVLHIYLCEDFVFGGVLFIIALRDDILIFSIAFTVISCIRVGVQSSLAPSHMAYTSLHWSGMSSSGLWRMTCIGSLWSHLLIFDFIEISHKLSWWVLVGRLWVVINRCLSFFTISHILRMNNVFRALILHQLCFTFYIIEI